MKPLNSTIKTVTVYSNLAAIMRVATVSLPKGETLVAFERLPETIVEKSIQVKGYGNAVLGNVKIEKAFFEDDLEGKRNELVEKALKAEDEVRISKDKIQRLNKEKAFLDSIVQKITSPQEESKGTELDPDKWLKMISFYQEKLETLDKNILTTEKERNKSQETLDQLKAGLTKLGNPQTKKQKFRVSALVDAAVEGEVTLELTYHVPNAQWYPVYDIRVNSDDKKVNLTYQAMVAQSSGEDWENTELKISTAKPKTHGNLPVLYAQHIDLGNTEDYEAPAPMASRMMSRSGGPGGGAGMAGEEMKKLGVKLEAGATSISYVIGGTHTVKSGGSEEKVTLLTEDFSAQFNYATVPVIQPFVYLTAKVKNHTEFQFLAGDANVFLDGNFVTIAKLKTIAPTEEFSLSLGVDESFKVERKLIHEFEKEGGNMFSKKSIVKSFDYITTIQNLRKAEEEVTIWDQIPISPKDTVKVNLLEPVYKGDTDTLKKDEEEIMRWIVKVKPGESVKVPLKYSVEFPTELQEKIFI